MVREDEVIEAADEEAQGQGARKGLSATTDRKHGIMHDPNPLRRSKIPDLILGTHLSSASDRPRLRNPEPPSFAF